MKKTACFVITLIVSACAFISASNKNDEKTGILILAHGGKANWNQAVYDAAEPLRSYYPVEIVFGMANPRTMQAGIDNLEKQGVSKIVVVPLFISSYSFIIRQNEYLLGIRKELADPPFVMDHGDGMEQASDNKHEAMESNDHQKMPSMATAQHEGGMATIKPLNINAQIILTKPLDDSQYVADILYKHIAELSLNPDVETVIIVGHGPEGESDNRNWILTIERLADRIQELQLKKGPGFRMIFSVTVRDDASKEIYDQAKENLRSLVRQAGVEGDVIVVPLLLSQGGIEEGIITRLEGLDYKWNGKTLLPELGISGFLENTIRDALRTR